MATSNHGTRLAESLDPAELRLLYAAVTRARQALDHLSVPLFHGATTDGA
jgi:hypothetical protein